MDVDGVECGRVVVRHFSWPAEPLWGTALADGCGARPAAATVLIGAQLATGRARRDDMQELFDSFPVSAATRTPAHLTALSTVLAFARRDPSRPMA
jgi:hypothetical protein